MLLYWSTYAAVDELTNCDLLENDAHNVEYVLVRTELVWYVSDDAFCKQDSIRTINKIFVFISVLLVNSHFIITWMREIKIYLINNSIS